MVNGQTITLPGGTNQAGGILNDGMNPFGAPQQVSFSLDQFVGSEIRIVFSFDSVTSSANTFYGWAIDNLEVEGQSVSVNGAETIIPGIGVQPVGLGNFLGNSDGFQDVGFLSDGGLEIFSGGSAFATTPVQTIGGTFAGAELLASGDIDGDTLPDAVISGADASWSVIRDGGGIFELTQSNVGGLRPIGDFSGDGLVDLTASVLEPTVSIEAGTGDNVHAVTHVYLGDDMAELLARLTASTPNPQLAFEMPDAIFQPESSASSLRTGVPLFGTFGDINGDGRDDLGLYSPLRNGLHVVFGGELTPVAGGGSGIPLNLLRSHQRLWRHLSSVRPACSRIRALIWSTTPLRN